MNTITAALANQSFDNAIFLFLCSVYAMIMMSLIAYCTKERMPSVKLCRMRSRILKISKLDHKPIIALVIMLIVSLSTQNYGIFNGLMMVGFVSIVRKMATIVFYKYAYVTINANNLVGDERLIQSLGYFPDAVGWNFDNDELNVYIEDSAENISMVITSEMNGKTINFCLPKSMVANKSIKPFSDTDVQINYVTR